MSANWLPGLRHHADQPDQPEGMPVFAGQKLAVIGGSSGMGATPPPTWWQTLPGFGSFCPLGPYAEPTNRARAAPTCCGGGRGAGHSNPWRIR